MDNKENRQFYWEVKNFVGKKHDPISKQPASKPNLVENVKSVLNQNSLYRQSNFNPNLTSLNSVSQAINIINHTNHEGNPNCPAYTKNVHRNAFGIIKESISTLPRYSTIIQASLGQTQPSDSPPSGPIPGPTPVDPDRYDPDLDPDAERGYGPEEESGTDDVNKGRLSFEPSKEVDDIVGNLKRAYGMPSPINVSGAERSAAAAERNAAIRDANIAAEAERNRKKQKMLNAKTPEEKAAAMQDLRNFNDRTMRGSGENLGGAQVALKYASKAAENALPYGDRPISPFYKITRNQFKQEFGRDYDESGGANTANMRALENWKTNLPGRIREIESIEQSNAVHAAKIAEWKRIKDNKSLSKEEKLRLIELAGIRAKIENPIYKPRLSDYDVAPRPGEISPSGRPVKLPPGTGEFPTKREEEPLSASDLLALSIDQQKAELELIKKDPEYRKKLRDAEIARIQSQPGFLFKILKGQ